MTQAMTNRIAAIAVLIAAALIAAPAASAESTALCKVDESPCEKVNQVSHVHETSVGKAKLLTSIHDGIVSHVHEVTPSGKKAQLLTSIGNVECTVLFLGSVWKQTTPLIEGTFTYTNCELLGGSCTAIEEGGPAEMTVTGEGHESAIVSEEFLVHLTCGSSIDCNLSGTGLLGIVKGPLLSTRENGETVLLGQSLTKEAGSFLCPKTTKLDLTTTPLEAFYIAEPEEGKAELCTQDPGESEIECPWSNGITFECDTLFLGDAALTLANPLIVTGSFTYSNCNHECVVTEENGPAEIKVLKEGHETAKVTGEGLVHLVCGGFINCSYNGTGLAGTAKGPLLSAQTPDNGEVTLSEQSTTKETGGFLCPKTAKLDITTSPLSAIYISS